MIKIDREIGEYAIVGGAFLGGGGGGSCRKGLSTLEEALKLGEIIVKDIEEFENDEIILTASAVGSPASNESFVSVSQIIESYNLFQEIYKKPIAGIVTNENGGGSTANGWILAALTGIPIVDAPCNGRAHPTGVMGSMGLEMTDEYISVQVAAGGKDSKNITTFVQGNIESAARVIRQSAVEAGGLVAVLRNPVEADYVAKNGSPHAIKQAIKIGEIFLKSKNTDDILEGLKKFIGMEVIARGRISQYKLLTEGGFDRGYIEITENESKTYFVNFWNEFMTVDYLSNRLATFPDLIGCIDVRSGRIVTSAEIKENDEVYLYKVSSNHLILGAVMSNRSQFKLIENILGVDVIKYVFEEA